MVGYPLSLLQNTFVNAKRMRPPLYPYGNASKDNLIRLLFLLEEVNTPENFLYKHRLITSQYRLMC